MIEGTLPMIDWWLVTDEWWLLNDCGCMLYCWLLSFWLCAIYWLIDGWSIVNRWCMGFFHLWLIIDGIFHHTFTDWLFHWWLTDDRRCMIDLWLLIADWLMIELFLDWRLVDDLWQVIVDWWLFWWLLSGWWLLINGSCLTIGGWCLVSYDVLLKIDGRLMMI